jgi:transcriptional regulator with XRE-family HTH domain
VILLDIKIDNRIKERINEINKKAGKRIITVRKIAKKLDVSEDYIWRIIRGDRNPSQKIQFGLASILECNVSDLFFIKKIDL